jgi:hypothetical protein
MKTKLLVLTAALIGAASLSANAGVFVSIGLPFPRVVVASAPVVYATPVAPVIETVPPCPAVGYVWAPGYWGTGHVWVGGSWRPGPAAHVGWGHPYAYHYGGWHH